MKFEKRSYQSEKYDEFIFHQRKMCRLHFELNPPLFPFCFEHEIRRETAWFDAPPSHYVMLVALKDGENFFRIQEKSYRLKPGKILFVPELVPYYFSSSGYIHRYVLELKGSHITSICHSLRLNKPEVFDFSMDDHFLEMFKKLGEEVDTLDTASFGALMGKSYQLLVLLALRRSETIPKLPLIQKLLSMLESDLSLHISLTDLSKENNLSKATLTRMVKRATGMTPIQYRAQCRIKQAIYYLEIPELSIKEIAYRLGYCSQFYFSEEFKRFTGKTPTEYRRYQKTLPKEK